MTDPITTPAQMREAAAQLVENVIYRFHAGFYCHDTAAAIRALPVAEPLCTWPSCGHTAKGQCRTYTSGQLIAPNDASSTATNIPVAERDALWAALEEIADGLKGIARDIQIGPEDEGRDIYDMALAIRDDAREALKGPEE